MPQKSTITINALAPIHREEGLSILTTDAATLQIGQRAGLARSQRKALKKLLGEDSERIKAHLARLDLYGLFNEEEQQDWDISQPIDIDRLTAFRTLFLLPGDLVDTGDLSAQQQKDDSLFYMATSLWMVSRELGKSVAAAKTLKQLSFDRYEPYARVSGLRFDMIRRMCEMDVLPIQNPSAAWLIAEASNHYLLREQRVNPDRKITSKLALYRGMKASLDALGSSDCRITQECLEDREVIRRFAEVINAEARKLASAKTDPMFEEQYLKPYLTAWKAWNSYYFKELKPSRIERRRPGPEIGRKYTEC